MSDSSEKPPEGGRREEIVPSEEATQWLVKGLRLLAANLEDGLAEKIRFEHYSETSASGKKYIARLEYRNVDDPIKDWLL